MLSFYARCSMRAPLLNSSHSLRFFSNTTRRWNPTKAPSPSSHRFAVEQGRPHRIQMLATKMLEAGRDELYRNTAIRGYVATALGVMTLSYCGIFYLYSTRLWDDTVAKDRGLAWYVPKAYQATMVCWGFFAAYAFTRTLGIVKAMKLVRTADKIMLETTIRRPIPFVRAEKYLTEPHNLVINRAKLYGSYYSEGMITAPEGDSIITKITRTLFYAPFHNTRKTLGGVGLVQIQLGPVGTQRHANLDADGQFSNGGQDLLDLSEDEV